MIPNLKYLICMICKIVNWTKISDNSKIIIKNIGFFNKLIKYKI